MDRRIFNGIVLAIISIGFTRSAYAASDKVHRVAIQIDSEDRKVQAVALGNAHNYAAYYKAKGELFEIEVVAFGPGYSILRADMSMMKGGAGTSASRTWLIATRHGLSEYATSSSRERREEAGRYSAASGHHGDPKRHRTIERVAGERLGLHPTVISGDAI